jgi:hypothetical protein
MSLRLGSQVWPGRAVLVPTPGPEKPDFFREHTRHRPKFTALTQPGGVLFDPACAILAPEISQNLRGIVIAPVAFFAQIMSSHAE